MTTFVGFPKIGQYRHTIQGLRSRETFVGMDENGDPIYDGSKLLPTVTFKGTVKLHGTNAAVCEHDGEIWCQSRTQVITPVTDNHGFATAMSDTATHAWFKGLFSAFRKTHEIPDDEIVCIFGEWCGGSVQKKVALTQLDKRFVVFAARVVGFERKDDGNHSVDKWYPIKGISDPEYKIYNIEEYQTWEIDINLNTPDTVVSRMDEITAEVGKQCPFAKAFGAEGIGEGVVWTAEWKGERYCFKIKDEAHKVVKSEKKKTSVDPEKLANVQAFVEYSVTENRLEQAIEQVFTSKNIEPTQKGTGDFLRWINNDIITEELDTLAANGLDRKDVNGAISTKARGWFFSYLDKQVFGDN